MKSPQSKNILTQFKTIVKAFFFSDLRFLKGFFEFSFYFGGYKCYKIFDKNKQKNIMPTRNLKKKISSILEIKQSGNRRATGFHPVNRSSILRSATIVKI